jgi:uncharacterized membrane protein YfcA
MNKSTVPVPNMATSQAGNSIFSYLSNKYVLGALALIIIAVAAYWFFMKKKKAAAEDKSQKAPLQEEEKEVVEKKELKKPESKPVEELKK